MLKLVDIFPYKIHTQGEHLNISHFLQSDILWWPFHCSAKMQVIEILYIQR